MNDVLSIDILKAGVTLLGSQAAVAKKLGISRQRLNNWLSAGKMPMGWDYQLAARLGVNGSKGSKRRGNGHSQRG